MKKADQLKLLELLSLEEKAYIAGLVDGEGCIAMLACKKYDTAYPSVMLAMTHKPVIEWFSQKTGARFYLHNQTNLRRNPGLKPQYMVRLNGAAGKKLCGLILPYLKVKNEQAQLVTEFPEEYRLGPGCPLTDEAKALRLAIKNKVDALNSPNSKRKKDESEHILPKEYRQKYGIN